MKTKIIDTPQKAMAACLRLWRWCAKTGLHKIDWPYWFEYEEMQADCPLCQLAKHEAGMWACGECLIGLSFGDFEGEYGIVFPINCFQIGFGEWEDAQNKGDKKAAQAAALYFYNNLEIIAIDMELTYPAIPVITKDELIKEGTIVY